MRMLILDAVEAIEIHVRSQLAYHFSQKHGAFSYLQRDLLPGFNPRYGDYERWVQKLEEQMKRSRTNGYCTYWHGTTGNLLFTWFNNIKRFLARESRSAGTEISSQ